MVYHGEIWMDPSYFTNVSYITVTPSDEGAFRMEFVSSCYLPGKHTLRELYLSPAENLVLNVPLIPACGTLPSMTVPVEADPVLLSH